jgi:ABC-type multidrug transport system fused ATPase/permease subunit
MENERNEPPSLALSDINLTINSGEKIAICGRTGSGKSSLIALILKLLDPLPNTPGKTIIDKLPLHLINRSILRQRMIAVPQEPVFLPDGTTFQANLDPYDVSTPDICQEVLEIVGLWPFIQSRGGLQAGMTAGTFSTGQRGLFSLARAVLRRRLRSSTSGGILLLDEVSSSVDTETERVMQGILRSEFENYTIIAVSHRLDMVMDFDRVVVMDLGKVVEVGNPVVLAGEEGTRFAGLVKAGGK